MSKRVVRNKLLDQKEADFYSALNWKGKSKRLRKKANRILENDCCPKEFSIIWRWNK